MKRLVVFCDGTWNTPEQEHLGRPSPTNVVKLRNCVAETDSEGVEQRVYYHPGVGTQGNFIKRAIGGAWGDGLGRNVQSAYHWLSRNYLPDDQVLLFGFSRGAYTVRSLAGMMGSCGLLSFQGLAPDEAWRRVSRAYDEWYRRTPKERDPTQAPWITGNWERHLGGAPPSIRFLGVWDTVGALGVPDDKAMLNLLDRSERWRFHDTELGASVEIARHALALDELRANFTPTRWLTADDSRDVEELWFPGVHSNVGGGYSDAGLSDTALAWMAGEAGDAGLGLKDDQIAQILPNHRGVLHDSYTGVFKAFRTRPRATPPIQCDRPDMHESAYKRHVSPPLTQGAYRRTRPVEVGDARVVNVYAKNHWSETGMYLKPGKYRFDASGEWLDKSIACGPGGANNGKFKVGKLAHIFGTMIGVVERGFRRMTGNKSADFWLTRRNSNAPWFSLVGVIANNSGIRGPNPDGSAPPHQEFEIGTGVDLTVENPGWLFAYANDAWDFYGNNSGSVSLTVARIP